jgi:outer membrane protein, heavy metal efflux system
MKLARPWAALGLVVALSACAPFEARRGIDQTRAMVAERGISADAPADTDCSTTASASSAEPTDVLDGESALAVALACNAALAAEFARLGVANAEAFEARRLANPTLDLGAARSNEGGGTRIDLGIAQNFTNLVLRGPRTRLAEGEFLRAQQRLGGHVLELAAEVESARARLVMARQIAQARALIAEAADAAAELAERYRVAGNVPAREVALARARGAERTAEWRQAGDDVAIARAGLQRLLGVDRLDDAVVGSASLAPVVLDGSLASWRARAMQQRLDLAAARGLVGLLADSARTARRLGALGSFEVGVEAERETDGARLIGPTLSIQLPLFHQGQGTHARADALAAWSVAEQRRLQIDVVSEVDLAVARVQGASARVADFRERIRPARAAVVARMQEEVNAMLRGVFELVDARIDELEAAIGTFEALGDHAVARASLERAIGARLPHGEVTMIEAATLLGAGAELPSARAHEAVPNDGSTPHHEHGDLP